MKPDCRRVLSQIASYSVEELSQADIDSFTRHLEDCPPCKGQWLLFEKTLVTLSHTPEADITVERSQQMWLACLEHAKTKNSVSAQHSAQKVEVLPQPSSSGISGGEGDRRTSTAYAPAPIGARTSWLQLLIDSFTPRLGFATAGVAAALLGASYFLSPSPQTPVASATVALPAMPSVRANLVEFQVPPHATTGMVGYHSAMAFDPFSDHVAPTLVSYTATQQ